MISLLRTQRRVIPVPMELPWASRWRAYPEPAYPPKAGAAPTPAQIEII